VRGQDEVDAALTHRFHERQNISAGHTEAALDSGGPENGDDEIRVVHVLYVTIAASNRDVEARHAQ
jgi:hypothetical protein